MYELFEALTAHAVVTPDKIAVQQSDGQSLTYGGLLAAIDDVRQRIPDNATTIAVRGIASAAWIVADLAVSFSGRRLVPLPFFFSKEQTNHLVHAACVDLIIDTEETSGIDAEEPHCPTLKLPLHAIVSQTSPVSLPSYDGGAERIIFTSGTTGRPKGVIHSDRQTDHAISAISIAAMASARDRHLCLLPHALLLEQIAGYMVPLTMGAEIVIATDAVLGALANNGEAVATAISAAQPSTAIMVPGQLSALTRHAAMTGWRPPSSLRLVAVGGAPLGSTTLNDALAIGLPVRFGYGLSECCSVVAFPRDTTFPVIEPHMPDVGTPLPESDVWIEDGEIVVRSPGVMNGYLGQPPLQTDIWHTGDTGHLSSNGQLTVTGRRDRLLVLPNGRNVSPEWVETCALQVAPVAQARLKLEADGRLILETQANEPTTPNFIDRMTDVLRVLPGYARPSRVIVRNNAGVEQLGVDLTYI